MAATAFFTIRKRWGSRGEKVQKKKKEKKAKPTCLHPHLPSRHSQWLHIIVFVRGEQRKGLGREVRCGISPHATLAQGTPASVVRVFRPLSWAHRRVLALKSIIPPSSPHTHTQHTCHQLLSHVRKRDGVRRDEQKKKNKKKRTKTAPSVILSSAHNATPQRVKHTRTSTLPSERGGHVVSHLSINTVTARSVLKRERARRSSSQPSPHRSVVEDSVEFFLRFWGRGAVS